MMQIGRRPLAARHALSSLACALVAGAVFALPACNQDEDDSQAGPDAAAPVDASSSSEGGDASAATDGAAEAAVDPTMNNDPKDLDAVNGDPALDIASSQIYFENGAPWVRVTFFGAWPPASTLYSWACSVLLGTENAPVATYTTQASSGTQSDFTDGIDKAKVTYAAEAKGFRVRFADTALVFDRYGVECSVQKTAQGTRVQDASGTFVVTTKVQRPFGN